MFQEGKVYIDRFSRLFFYEHGSLHTSTGFKYSASNEEEYSLTRLTKDQLFEMVKDKKRSRHRYKYKH